ncbi:MAG: phosphoribosylglycinamide formyltransferase [Bdellovibrionota bacterium]|nr:phosphoribosylglycinamide formyltransferase [Bdellovibrionota bacterium]
MKAVILASGEGTNAENIVSFFQNKKECLEVVGIISDKAGSGVLERAKGWDIPTALIEKKSMKRSMHEREIYRQVKEWGGHWLLLAGYMRILGPHFISRFYDEKRGHSRIINIHPSLLPSFRGLRAYERAFEAKAPFSGVSVHFVDEGMDTGQLILQKKFNRLQEDSFEDFKKRGQHLEHIAYIEAIFKVLKGDYR